MGHRSPVGNRPDLSMLRSLTLTAVTSGLLLLPAPDVEAASCRPGAGQVLIPAGVFWVGSDAKERSLANSLSSPKTVAAGWFSAETPRYPAESEAFCVDQLLVTQAQYLDFVARAQTIRGRAFWSTTTPNGSRTSGNKGRLPLTGSIIPSS